MIFTWVGSCQKDEGMFWWWYRVPEITYQMAPLHTKRNSTKVIQKKGNKGKNQTWIPHSQPGASSMASPCLSGGVKLRRELDSYFQRHSISHHSVNLTFQDMMEWETSQTDARVVSWVYCKTPLHQNALQCVWSSSSGHVVELHRAAGCGQMGHISLLSQSSDLSVWDVLLGSSPAVRTGDVPEGGARVSEVDNLEQSPLKTCNLHKGWELNLCPGELKNHEAVCYCSKTLLIFFLFTVRSCLFSNFKLFILYWGIADEQYWGSFRWTGKGLSHTDTWTHSPLLLPTIQAGTWHWVEFHVLCNMSLLVIHSENSQNSAHLNWWAKRTTVAVCGANLSPCCSPSCQ